MREEFGRAHWIAEAGADRDGVALAARKSRSDSMVPTRAREAISASGAIAVSEKG